MENTQETPKKEKFDFGAITGSVIIIVLLLIAGWYFYQELEKVNDDLDVVNRSNSAMEERNNTTGSVESDLSKNPFDAIQLDLESIETEFETSADTEAQISN
jgi:hypothetical protein